MQKPQRKESPNARRNLLTRRRALQAGAVLAGGAFLEYESLSGHFDHSRPFASTAPAAYAASLRALGDPNVAAGAIVHIGHSTHLLSLANVRMLTDPWFYDPAFGALSHEVGPAVHPDDVDRLDAILITHDHPDHADMRAIGRMSRGPIVLSATNDLAARIRALGHTVHVPAPWEEIDIGGVKVIAVPGLHDVYEVGFVLKTAQKCVYFAGDSRLHPALREIAERFHPDVAILSVDGTRIRGDARWVMSPDDAVEATKTLGAKVVMPSHAEAKIFDPLARNVLATTVDDAARIFVEKVRAELPGVHAAHPAAGELFVL